MQKESRGGGETSLIKKIGERQRGGCGDGVKRKRTSCLLLMGSSSACLVCSLVT